MDFIDPEAECAPPSQPTTRQQVAARAPQTTTKRNKRAEERALPHSIEAEEYLLSCCFLDGSETVSRCSEAKLSADTFYIPANRIIFEKLLELHNKGVPIDLQILAEELKTSRQLDAVGGYAYLSHISTRIPTTAQADYFIEKLRELEVLRDLILVSTRAAERCYSYEGGGIEQFAQQLEAGLQDVLASARKTVRFTDRPASDFFDYPKRDKAKLLLGHEGALKRGGAIEWVAPTGQGKTSSVTDACMEWCRGKDFMGMVAHSALKILIVQAEDDEEAMGKIVASFCARHKLTDDDKALLAHNLIITQVKGVIGPEFMSVLEQKCKLHRPDIVVVNPVNRYVHGSMSDDVVALQFTAWLDNINVKLGDSIGFICVSHTGKPPKGEERRASKSHWELAYASIGSSAWANYYRTTVFLEPREQVGRYYLVLGKNYRSWGIRQEYEINGETHYAYVQKIPVKHSDMVLDVDGHARPMIVWEPDTDDLPEEPEEKSGPGRKRSSAWKDEELVGYFPSSKQEAGTYAQIARFAREGCGIPESTFHRRRAELDEKGWIVQIGNRWQRTELGDDYANMRVRNGR